MRDKYNREISVGQHITDQNGMVYEVVSEDDGLRDTRISLREVRTDGEDHQYLLERKGARNMWLVSKKQETEEGK